MLLAIPNARSAIESCQSVYSSEVAIISLAMYQAYWPNKNIGFSQESLVSLVKQIGSAFLWRVFVLFAKPEWLGNKIKIASKILGRPGHISVHSIQSYFIFDKMVKIRDCGDDQVVARWAFTAATAGLEYCPASMIGIEQKRNSAVWFRCIYLVYQVASCLQNLRTTVILLHQRGWNLVPRFRQLKGLNVLFSTRRFDFHKNICY